MFKKKSHKKGKSRIKKKLRKLKKMMSPARKKGGYITKES